MTHHTADSLSARLPLLAISVGFVCATLWPVAVSAQPERRDPLAVPERLGTPPGTPPGTRDGGDSAGFSDDEFFVDYTDRWRRGEYEDALAQLEEQINRITRVPAQWMYDRAQLKFVLGGIESAIEDMQQLVDAFPDPQYLLRLAELYEYKGAMKDYRRALEEALDQSRRYRYYRYKPEQLLTTGRILERHGEDPRTLLTTVYKRLEDDHPKFIDGFVAAGELAFRRTDYQLASEYYDKALAIDEEHPAALAGLAECYWKSSDPRLEPVLEKLIGLNPRNPRAQAVRVEILLERGKSAEALEIIGEILAFNPLNLRFMALKAAAHFLDDDRAAMQAVQEKAVAFNPVFSEAWRVPGRFASHHYRFAEGAAFQRRALDVNPGDHEARGLLAFDLLRLGEVKEGRQLLEDAFEHAKYDVSLYNMLKLLDTMAGYATVERGPFILKLPADEKDIFAEEVLAVLDEMWALYPERYKVSPETPISIEIFDSHDDFMVRSVGLPGNTGYMGICFGRLVTMDSPSARTPGTMNWKSVLWHEFVHVITLQKTRNRMPRWLSEGISVYEETLKSPAWGQRMSVDYKLILAAEDLPGMTDLDAYFSRPKTAMHLMFGYFLAGEFVRFYVDNYGFDALVEALDRTAEAGDSETHLAAAASVEAEVIDAAFKEFLSGRFKPYENLPDVKPRELNPVAQAFNDATSTTLMLAGPHDGAAPESVFTSALERAGEAMRVEKWDEAEAAWLEALEAFPDYAGADGPRLGLIRLYEKTGRRDKLRAALRDQINFDGTDTEACRMLSDLVRENGDMEELLFAAERGLEIDPFSIPMRRDMLTASEKLGRGDEALRTLTLLGALDRPHAMDYRLRAIDVMIGMNQWDRARRETVALLETSPHFWEAQRRLLRIVEREN